MSEACTHPEGASYITYGLAVVSGWLGVGVHHRCPLCLEALWFDDDPEMNTLREKEINDKKREENYRWNPNYEEPQLDLWGELR